LHLFHTFFLQPVFILNTPRSRETCTCLTSSRPAGRRAASCDGRPASKLRGQAGAGRVDQAGPCRGHAGGRQECPGQKYLSRPSYPARLGSFQRPSVRALPTAVCALLFPHKHPNFSTHRSNLYDVFINIRDDELEHVKTMAACQDGSVALDLQVGRGCAAALLTDLVLMQEFGKMGPRCRGGGIQPEGPNASDTNTRLPSRQPYPSYPTPPHRRTCKALLRPRRSRTSPGWHPGPLRTTRIGRLTRLASGCRAASSDSGNGRPVQAAASDIPTTQQPRVSS